MALFKDLRDPAYWGRFGDLGPNIGRANMPTPREAADTVLSLMRDLADARAQVSELDRAIRLQRQDVCSLLLRFSNDANELRDRHLRPTAQPGEGVGNV